MELCGHSPRFELPASDFGQKDPKRLVVICHFCGDTKHKAMHCDKVSNDLKDQLNVDEVNCLLFVVVHFSCHCTLRYFRFSETPTIGSNRR